MKRRLNADICFGDTNWVIFREISSAVNGS